MALLVPSKHQTTDLEMIVRVLPNDLMRVHIAEKNPLNGRTRYEATDVLMPGLCFVSSIPRRLDRGTEVGCGVAGRHEDRRGVGE